MGKRNCPQPAMPVARRKSVRFVDVPEGEDRAPQAPRQSNASQSPSKQHRKDSNALQVVFIVGEQGHGGSQRRVTLRIDCTLDNAKVNAQLAIALKALEELGGDSVALVFVYGDDKDSQFAAARAAEDLGRAAPNIISFAILRAPSFLPTPPRLSSDILARLLGAFPHIRRLAITGCGGNLPLPRELRSLEELSLTDISEAACPRVTCYIPKITSLELHEVSNPSAIFPAIFREYYGSASLRKVTFSGPLNDAILKLLLEYAPSLTHLTIKELAIITEDASVLQWAVEELSLQAPKKTEPFKVEKLARLPRPASGRMTVKLPNYTGDLPDVHPSEGIPFTFHSRLQDWDIRAHALVLKCSTELVPWKTLRTALRQIDALHAPDSIIQLPEWSWTPAMLNVVATELPHLRFSVNITGGLTDELLGALHRCGPAVPQLVVDFLVLSSDEHCNAAWHWDDLTVHDRADVGQLLKLGDPRGRVSPPIVNIPRGVRIDSASVNEVGGARVDKWFKSVHFTGKKIEVD